jgi:hypothetical protein
MKNLDAVIDAELDGQMREREGNSLTRTFSISDVLGEVGPIEVDGVMFDFEVDIDVRQHGRGMMELHWIDYRAVHIVVGEYHLKVDTSQLERYGLLKKVEARLENIAVKIALSAGEDDRRWTYQDSE